MNRPSTLAQELDRRLGDILKYREKLARHTSLKIGGEADYFIAPRCLEDLEAGLALAKEFDLPWVVLGNGTNILFPDEGYRGMVIKLGPKMSAKFLRDDILVAQAGASVGMLMKYLHEHALNDLDFLAGIPATVGGALAMNAGIPEGTISDLVSKVRVLTNEAKWVTLTKDECDFGYRCSLFRQRKYIIVEGEFKVGGDKAWDFESLMRRRVERQPLSQPSPGCVFKNPEGVGATAGQLIDSAGLKGYKVGGAVISHKHANFIVNEGGATCKDILRLIDTVREYVLKYFGVELALELEVVST